MTEERGKFIVLESLDGGGSTTQAIILGDKLGLAGVRQVYLTNEPSDMPIGKLIRDYLKGVYLELGWREMTMLFMADRVGHSVGIENMLESGIWVVCDRYVLSTYAYQTAQARAEGVEMAAAFRWIQTTQECGIAKPDMTIFLDVEPEEALERVESSGREHIEIFEHLEMQKSVHEVYKNLFQYYFDSIVGPHVQIDGSGDIKAVTGLVLESLQSKGIVTVDDLSMVLK